MQGRGKSRLSLRKRSRGGYTLIEMLAAVLILAIVVIVSVPYVGVLISKSREESDISFIRQACARYEADYYTDDYAPPITDGENIEDFVRSMITNEQVNINYIDDGGFGAMPICVENGYACIIYKPRHANDKKECRWQLRLQNAGFEDEARAPKWAAPAPPACEPAGS